jgi:hypothetical protein
MKTKAFTLIELMLATILGMLVMIGSVGVIENMQRESVNFQSRITDNMTWVEANQRIAQLVRSSSYIELSNPIAGTTPVQYTTMTLHDYNDAVRGVFNNTPDGITYTNDTTGIGNRDANNPFRNINATFAVPVATATNPNRGKAGGKSDGKQIETTINYTVNYTAPSTVPFTSALSLSCRTAVMPDSDTWAETYPSPSGSFQIMFLSLRAGAGFGGGIIRNTADGGYIYINSAGSSYYIYLLKMAKDGTRMWSKMYGPGYCGNDVQQTADGGYIVAGTRSTFTNQQAILLKLNSDGSVASGWPKTIAGGIGGFTSTGSNHVILTDGGYLVSCWGQASGPGIGIVLKVDTVGNRLGYYMANNPASETDRQNNILSIAESRVSSKGALSGYVISGCTLASSFVIKLNTNLSSTPIWEKRITAQFVCDSSVQQIFDASGNDNGYVAVGWSGGMHLRQLDKNGNEVWKKTYPVQYNGTNEAADAVQAVLGGYIVSGHTISSYNYYDFTGHLFKTDASGNPIWRKNFNSGNHITGSRCNNWVIPYTVICVNDGGYLVAGQKALTSKWPASLYFAKTDENGKCDEADIPDPNTDAPSVTPL